MGGRNWTPEELERLHRLYPDASWDGLLTAFPGRTRSAITVQAITLSIKRKRDGRTLWKPTEKDRLRMFYPTAPWEQICESLPRHTRGSIGKMANGMGLRRDASRHSPYPVIRELRKVRRERGIRQEVLAKKIGTHPVQIANRERGEHMPRTRSLFDWIEALGFQISLEPR